MNRFKLLDLFCGAGGSAVGLYEAGFDIVGIDIKNQPNYPFPFVRTDVLQIEFKGFDAYWASPPCQRWSSSNKPRLQARHRDLIAPIRELLMETGKPFIIENVANAPLRNAVELRGNMFGLRVMRRRRFESNILLLVPPPEKFKGHTYDGSYVSVAGWGGRGSNDFDEWCNAMGIKWMNKYELTQAIPPVYAEFLGRQLLAYLTKGTKVANNH